MKWTVLAVGKLRGAAASGGVAEYLERIRRMRPVEMVEAPAAKAGSQDAAVARALAKEGRALLAKIKPADHVILLDRLGAARDSEALAAHLAALEPRVRGRLVFTVGGAFGVDESVRARANESISFGPITLPHELARLILVEQLYRALTIQRNLPYHH